MVGRLVARDLSAAGRSSDASREGLHFAPMKYGTCQTCPSSPRSDPRSAGESAPERARGVRAPDCLVSDTAAVTRRLTGAVQPTSLPPVRAERAADLALDKCQHASYRLSHGRAHRAECAGRAG